MNKIIPIIPKKIIHQVISRNGLFPGNSKYPLLIYKNVFNFTDQTTKQLQEFLNNNHWIKSWVDSIYPYHHYHSNTHEALVVFSGDANVQIGGENGDIFEIVEGDIIIFPAGVSHKNVKSSEDFTVIGSYPFDVEYDMNYGKDIEYPKVEENIKRVGLPAADPVFGKNGLLFNYWK